MRRFGTDKIKSMLIAAGLTDDQSIRSKSLTRSIETAQKKVEGNNYDIRKSLLDYDNVLNEQREIIYSRRNEILDEDSVHENIIETFKNTIENLVVSHIPPENYLTEDDKLDIIEYVNTNFLKSKDINYEEIENLNNQELQNYLFDLVYKDYENKLANFNELRDDFEKAVSLNIIDSNWVEHMSAMEHLKEGIGLRGYSQVNPVQAYTMEGFEMFDNLLNKIDNDLALFLLKSEVKQNIERKQTLEGNTNDGKEKVKKQPRKTNKIGRNEPCPCGSGKKYKQCCCK